MPIFRTLNQDFFKTWTLEMAYVLGFFAADGYMVKNKRGAHFIGFEITDGELLEKIRELLKSNHKITLLRKNKLWKPSHRLQIGSKEMFSDLFALGMTQNKSKTLKFPIVPQQYLPDFTRGYFDGDGCVHFKEYWRKDRRRMEWHFSTRFTSGSRELLIGLLEILNLKGGFISKKIRGYELTFSRHDSLALFKFMYHNEMSKSLCLERKREIFLKAFEVLKLRA